MSQPQVIQSQVELQESLAEVWGFFQTAENLTTLTPKSQKVRIEKGGDVPLHSGLEVRISVSPFPGIRTGWLTVIEEVHPPTGSAAKGWFRDTQRKGPFAMWNHIHRFSATEAGGTLVEDHLEYRVPMGQLGHWVAGWWVRKQIERLFSHRTQALIAHFGAA
jgi:ligand-binding SRPBCC domain-containing protein